MVARLITLAGFVAIASALSVDSLMHRPSLSHTHVKMAETPDPSETSFFAVHQTVDASAAEDWFAANMVANLKEAAKMQHAAGFFSHHFLPADDGSAILCIWEGKDATCAPEELQSFLEGPARPAGDALASSHVHKALASVAVTPKSCWPEMPDEPAESWGDFFWVRHELHDGAARDFWSDALARDTPFSSPYPELLHNHFFLPSGPAYPGGPIFSVWETREPMSIDEFQAFIDGPRSPAAGACTNAVHKVSRSFCALPSAAFPSRAFMGSMAMPLMEDTMGSLFGRMKPMFGWAASVVDDDEAAAKAAEPIAEPVLLDVEDVELLEDEFVPYGRWSVPLAEGASADAADDPNEALLRKIERKLPLKIVNKVPVKVKMPAQGPEAEASKEEQLGI
jgi:hypothetical protein